MKTPAQFPYSRHKRQGSDTLSEGDAAVIKLLISLGYHHKRIAALHDVNQGRITEIARGKKHADIKPYGAP